MKGTLRRRVPESEVILRGWKVNLEALVANLPAWGERTRFEGSPTAGSAGIVGITGGFLPRFLISSLAIFQNSFLMTGCVMLVQGHSCFLAAERFFCLFVGI